MDILMGLMALAVIYAVLSRKTSLRYILRNRRNR